MVTVPPFSRYLVDPTPDMASDDASVTDTGEVLRHPAGALSVVAGAVKSSCTVATREGLTLPALSPAQ